MLDNIALICDNVIKLDKQVITAEKMMRRTIPEMEFENRGKSQFGIYTNVNADWVMSLIHDEQMEEIERIKQEFKRTRTRAKMKPYIPERPKYEPVSHSTKVSYTESRAYAWLRSGKAS